MPGKLRELIWQPDVCRYYCHINIMGIFFGTTPTCTALLKVIFGQWLFNDDDTSSYLDGAAVAGKPSKNMGKMLKWLKSHPRSGLAKVSKIFFTIWIFFPEIHKLIWWSKSSFPEKWGFLLIFNKNTMTQLSSTIEHNWLR